MFKLIVKNLLIVEWKESILKQLFHAPPHHHKRLALTSSCNLQLIPPRGRSSLEFVRHKLDLFLHENISHVKNLSTS